jgi:hypothetical protein
VLAPGLRWIAHTEGGVNNHGNNWPEAQQAAYLNCMEDNSWHTSKNTRFAQYLLQDPFVGAVDTTYSGLRRSAVEGQRGAEKESYRAFRAPLTVKRTSSAIRVWGAWRPSPVPTQLTLVARGPSKTLRYPVQLHGGHYFDKNLAPGAADAGSTWSIEHPDGTTVSRTASEGDCS